MSLETRENELQAQVQKLQREIRFMKRWGAIAAVALLALVVVLRVSDHRRISTQQVVAKDFVLIDSDDRARVRVVVFPQGSEIKPYAASGERRVQLVGDGEHARLSLYIPAITVREGASANFFRSDVLLSSLRSDLNGTKLEKHSQLANGGAVLNLDDESASLLLIGTGNGVPRK